MPYNIIRHFSEAKGGKHFRRTRAEIEQGFTIAEARRFRESGGLSIEPETTIDLGSKTVISSPIGRGPESPNHKRFIRKKWVFTMHNYTEEDVDRLQLFITEDCECGGFQGELSSVKKTPHLQGFFITKRKRRFTSFGLKEGTHYELMRGSIVDNVAYCTKAESYDEERGVRFLHNVKMPVKRRLPKILREEELFMWQKYTLEICRSEPNNRIIYWKHDVGNTGKSEFVKFLCATMNCVMLTGSAKDIQYGIVQYFEKNAFYPDIICVDLPRSTLFRWNNEDGGMSFAGIEQIKNGLFFSGKYKSCQVLMPTPHIFIFANEYPNRRLYTHDRWDIQEIVLTNVEIETLLEKAKEENFPSLQDKLLEADEKTPQNEDSTKPWNMLPA